VLLSFRGEDIRASFRSHLYTSLKMMEIKFIETMIWLKEEITFQHQ